MSEVFIIRKKLAIVHEAIVHQAVIDILQCAPGGVPGSNRHSSVCTWRRTRQ